MPNNTHISPSPSCFIINRFRPKSVAGMVDWLDLDDFQKCMDVNYMGTVRCCKAFLPILKQQAIDGCHTYSASNNNAGGAIMAPPAARV